MRNREAYEQLLAWWMCNHWEAVRVFVRMALIRKWVWAR